MVKSIISIFLGATALFGNLAFADPAIRIDDFGCGMSDGNGNFVFTDISHAVITDSGNGNLICKADVTPPAGGHAVQYSFDNTGDSCGTFNGLTEIWHQIVSASGKATLICHTQG